MRRDSPRERRSLAASCTSVRQQRSSKLRRCRAVETRQVAPGGVPLFRAAACGPAPEASRSRVTRARVMMGMGPGTMGRRGMMGGGMMGAGAMGPPMMMRIIFALMDSDGDGTIELPEFQAAHEWIFKAMDSNKDGRLTQEEMRAFMRGTRSSATEQ